MPAFLYWTTPAGASKALWFDATIEEDHHLSSSITEYPVEEGINVTDNVRPDAETLSLTCFVSNAPIVTKAEVSKILGKQGYTLIGTQEGTVRGETLDVNLYEPPLVLTPGGLFGAIGSAIGTLLHGKKEYKAQVLKFAKDFDNVQDVYFALKEVRDTGQRISVVTSVRTYENMVIQDLSLPRTAEMGTGATIVLQLREIRVVSTKKVPAPKALIAMKKKSNGAKPTEKKVDKPYESMAYKTAPSLGAAVGSVFTP